MRQSDGTTERAGRTSPEEMLAAGFPAAARQAAGIADPELRAALTRMCDQAHRQGWRVEQLILELKRAWAAGGRVGSREDRMAEQALLERAVTFCIEEFYRST